MKDQLSKMMSPSTYWLASQPESEAIRWCLSREERDASMDVGRPLSPGEIIYRL